MTEISGVFAPMVTPFRTDGVTIDFAWIPYHLQYLQEQGLDGVVPMGTTGEGPSLSVDERKALLDTVMARRGTLKVVPGVGTPSLTETIDLVRHAFAAGAESVLVLPPYYWRNVSDEGLLSYFRTLCDEALSPGQRIMLYHIPQISGVPITLNVLDDLYETHGECILGLKDSTGHVNSFLQFMHRYPNLRVFVGSDRLVGVAYELGVAGTITAAANLVPRAIQEIRARASRGEDYTARTGLPMARICCTAETRTVIPRSLKEPVWLLPLSFTHRSGTPICSPRRVAWKRLVLPSNMLTMLSSWMLGRTHSL